MADIGGHDTHRNYKESLVSGSNVSDDSSLYAAVLRIYRETEQWLRLVRLSAGTGATQVSHAVLRTRSATMDASGPLRSDKSCVPVDMPNEVESPMSAIEGHQYHGSRLGQGSLCIHTIDEPSA